LRDRIEIRREDTPVFLDAIRFSGDWHTHLSKPHIANGAGAMALIVLASSSAEGHLKPVREMLPDIAGATLIRKDLLVIRILASNSFALRRTLIPVLRRLNKDTLPRCWML
jgi:urease accessory protein